MRADLISRCKTIVEPPDDPEYGTSSSASGIERLAHIKCKIARGETFFFVLLFPLQTLYSFSEKKTQPVPIQYKFLSRSGLCDIIYFGFAHICTADQFDYGGKASDNSVNQLCHMSR